MEDVKFMNSESMLDQMLVSDISISFLDSFYAVLFTVVGSFVVRHLYVVYGRSMNNRANLGNSFLLLGLVICCIIIIVKYSIALSLGLVGALSIVRFRAAIKEPEELVYLFLIIGLGIAFGANQFLIGFLLLVFSVLIIIGSARFLNREATFEVEGHLVIVEGPLAVINEWRKRDLVNIATKSVTMMLKEVELRSDTDKGRLVINFEASVLGCDAIDLISASAIQHQLSINIISDTQVAE